MHLGLDEQVPERAMPDGWSAAVAAADTTAADALRCRLLW